jgi:predicted Zn-dependent peptidase
VVTTRATEQAHIVLGMRTPGRHDERRFALGVLNHALGGGISSRLFQEVRERRGLAYAVWSERSSYDEVGSLSVSVGTAPENAQEVLRLVVKELDRLGEDGLTRRELEVAKGHWRAETILALEDPGSRMARIGSSMLLHSEVVEVEELLERVMSVSLEEVGTLAAELAAAPRVLSVVGPFEPGDFEDMEYSAVRAAGARG